MKHHREIFGVLKVSIQHLFLILSKQKQTLLNSSPCHFSSRYALYLRNIVRTIDDDHPLPKTYQWGLAPVIGGTGDR